LDLSLLVAAVDLDHLLRRQGAVVVQGDRELQVVAAGGGVGAVDRLVNHVAITQTMAEGEAGAPIQVGEAAVGAAAALHQGQLAGGLGGARAMKGAAPPLSG